MRDAATASAEKPSEPSAVTILPVRWNAEEWDLLTRAAAAFAEREHMPKTTPTDIIRSGALRRAEEILDGAAATR